MALAWGCREAPPSPPPSPTATPLASPQAPALAPRPTPSALVRAQVARVVDGDTIRVRIEGQATKEYPLRYIGIDTPETVKPGSPVECYGREAARRNQELVRGKTVELEKDVSETDRFGRLLRYVYVNGRMVNAILMEEGYARVAIFPPDLRYLAQFVTLQEQARQAGRGMWSACPRP